MNYHETFRALKDDLNKLIVSYKRGLVLIQREYDAMETECDRIKARDKERSDNVQRFDNRRKAWRRKLADDWTRKEHEIAECMIQFHRWQPPLSALSGRDVFQENTPDALSFGESVFAYEDLKCTLPNLVDFPLKSALILPEDNQLQLSLAHNLMLRLLSALPIGRLEFLLVDPKKQGQSFVPFLPLLAVERLMPTRRVLTHSDEIETAIAQVNAYMENLIQKQFAGTISDWNTYNHANPDRKLRYKVLLFFDVPEQLTEKTLWYLQRLAENGPKCGILPVLAVNSRRIDDSRFKAFRAFLENNIVRVDSRLNNEQKSKELLLETPRPEASPAPDNLNAFVRAVGERYEASSKLCKSFSDLWAGRTKGNTSTNGIEIPVGWNEMGRTVAVTLGATGSEHHVLLAGKTGSGKSNLLHVLIHSVCERYSPRELNLYLLDYKESTEFTVYASPSLPHARLVATESDVEYGVTVLHHLVGELKSRADLFKRNGVRDFAEYRIQTGQSLPRLFLIVDEFQILFSDTRQNTEAAEQLLARLLKQGRSFGIHILLSTQTLKGLNALSLGTLLSQLGVRLALACGQDDSSLILGDGSNWAAAELQSPPEAILNTSNGAKSGNQKFSIPLAKESICREHLDALARNAAKAGVFNITKVFNGAHLPDMPAPAAFQTAVMGGNALCLGECLTFDAPPLMVPLTTCLACNVLFCGYNAAIHDGLLASALSSIAACENIDSIVYFNARGIPAKGLSAPIQTLGSKFRQFDNLGALPLKEIADSIGSKRNILIIDGLDAEKELQPAQSYAPQKPGDADKPANLLKRIAEEGTRKSTFVFVFIDNWRRCAGSCKELFNNFELRVAFCMNEDDAGALVSGGIGKFKGIEKPNRAVFINRLTNDTFWFRPYSTQTQETNDECIL